MDILAKRGVRKFDIGSYVIEGATVDVVAHIGLRQQWVKLTVPLPPNYPDTQLSRQLAKHGNNLLEGSLYYDNGKYGQAVEIRHLYSIPRKAQLPQTHQEATMIKGLGRRTIGKVLGFVADYLGVKGSDTVVAPTDGGAFPCPSDPVRREELLGQSNAYLLKTLASCINLEVNDEDDDVPIDKDHLIDKIMTYEKNFKLMSYYRDFGGFEPVEIGEQIIMVTTVSSLIERCSS